MNLKSMTLEVDTHTHTVISGHAWSTLTENASAAAAKGMKGICLTEHGPQLFGGAPDYIPHSQRMLPDTVCGIRVYKGIEANILDSSGRLDIPEEFLKLVEFGIASYHPLGGNGIIIGNKEENTAAFKKVLSIPYIDIIGHADDPKVPCDLEALVLEAKKLGKLLELNNNRVASGIYDHSRMKDYILLCKKHGQRVCVGTDAHFSTMVGNAQPILELMDSVGFPSELVVNLTQERFESYLSERKKRIESI